MEKIIEILNNGGVVVIPTDTIYGISARAMDEKAVEKVHAIKDRNNPRPFIILISSIQELKIFDIEIDDFTEEVLKKYWPSFAFADAKASAGKPGKVTIILDCPNEKFEYLCLGTKSIAFRIPDKNGLIEIIKKTGPLVSTSVNPESQKPASTISEAKEYFGEKIDFYLDEGRMQSPPSTVIRIKDGKIIVEREGAVKIV